MNWKTRKPTGMDSKDEKMPMITLSTDGFHDAPVGNKIYLYDDISRESILNISKQIDDVTRQLKTLQLFYGLKESPTIELHISSDGGEINPALSLVDKIKSNIIPIDTYCEGMNASAGTLISVVGRRRYITKNSHVLIHQLSSSCWGNFEQISDEKQNLDLYMDMIKCVYLKHTKFKPKQLSEIMKHDWCLTADQCIKFGIVDEII